MREIEFRGKRKDIGKWICGNLIYDNISGKYWIDLSINESEKINGGLHIYAVEVDPETVGQYTGLKDKNGIKIYEGDIIQQYNVKANGIVIYKYGQFGINGLEMFWNIHSSQTKVIGNIHDNPELLERKD